MEVFEMKFEDIFITLEDLQKQIEKVMVQIGKSPFDSDSASDTHLHRTRNRNQGQRKPLDPDEKIFKTIVSQIRTEKSNYNEMVNYDSYSDASYSGNRVI